MKNIENVLIIGKVWPEPDSSAAGTRMIQLIRLFKSKGWKVTFVSAASDSKYAADLETLGVAIQYVKMNDSSFNDFTEHLNPDLVLFDRFMTEEQFGWRVKESCPKAMSILDSEDLHGLREGRRLALAENRSYITADLHNDVSRREIASIYRCDLTLIISRAEMSVLDESLGMNMDLVSYLPILTETKQFRSKRDYSERIGFISIGNFLHEPNLDSVRYLKESIWPEIRKHLPEAEVHIYGAYPSPKVEQLHSEKDGFLIKGRAENALDVISKARLLLAPLRFGAGLKGKLFDAMTSGTPSVTTSIGAEGMQDDLKWPGAIEDDPIQFAKATIEMYQNEEIWYKAQSRINPILNDLFYIELHSESFLQKIIKLYSSLDQHRSRNFIGSMLWHHSLASTKYMGKWIEEKNK